jgi:hypothetical protein
MNIGDSGKRRKDGDRLAVFAQKPATGNGHGAADDTAVSSFTAGETVTLPL